MFMKVLPSGDVEESHYNGSVGVSFKLSAAVKEEKFIFYILWNQERSNNKLRHFLSDG